MTFLKFQLYKYDLIRSVQYHSQLRLTRYTDIHIHCDLELQPQHFSVIFPQFNTYHKSLPLVNSTRSEGFSTKDYSPTLLNSNTYLGKIMHLPTRFVILLG